MTITYKIRHPVRRIINFEPRDYQKTISSCIDFNNFLVINKGRQLGITTSLMIKVIDECIKKRDYSAVFLTILPSKDIKKMFDNLLADSSIQTKVGSVPLNDFVRSVNSVPNKVEYNFENYSKLTICSKHLPSCLACGASNDMIITDEASYMNNFQEIYSSLFPTLIKLDDSRGKFIITIGGQTTDFLEKIKKNYFNITLTSYMNQVSDIESFKKYLSSEQFKSEHLCEFKVIE